MPSHSWPKSIPGLRTKLGLFVGSFTAIVVVASAWVTSRYFESRMRASLEEATVLDAEELRGVLEEQMRRSDRAALTRLVNDIGRAPEVAWVAVVNDEGEVRFSSSKKGPSGGRLPANSPEMSILRAASPDRPSRTTTLFRDGCSVLRSFTPLPNMETCRSCHPASKAVTGALIIDRSLGPLQRAVSSAGAHLAIGGAATLLVLLGSIGFAVERVVLRPLERLRAATRRVAEANFDARASQGSEDEIGELSRDFDEMASRLQIAMASCSAERRQLGDLIDGISDGILLLDPELRVIKVNEAFLRRLDANGPLPEGLTYREIVAQARLSVGGDPLPAERTVASGRLEKQVVRVRAGEREGFEEIYAQPLRLADGRAAVVEVWRDITQRKELEAGLEQSERLAAIGLLSSSVAHEVGNPLASILTVVDGELERLQRGERSSTEKACEALELVRRQVFRCRSVTQRLLGLARAPADRVARVDAAEAVSEVLALVAAQARSQRVEIRADVERPLYATAVEQHLQQIFLNVVLNALNAMPRGGTLSVAGRQADGTVRVRFADTGPGIPEAIQRKLFRPFVRDPERESGSGLGLFITHALVSRCGGSIEFASEEGKGTAFTVHLPAARAAAQEVANA